MLFATMVAALALLAPAGAADGPVPLVVGPDPTAAGRTAVLGATPAELAAARSALAAVPDLAVERIVFRQRYGVRGIAVVTAGEPFGVDERTRFLSELVARLIGRGLEGSGHPIRWVDLPQAGYGTRVEADPWPARTADELAGLARQGAERLAAAGWQVVEARAWPAGAGAVALTIRLTERQLLDGRTDWASTLTAGEQPTWSQLLTVQAPDGSELPYAGVRGTTPGAAPPPADPTGPTRLQLTWRGSGFPGPVTPPPRRYVLDCDGGPSRAIADVPAVCARLVADRYALLLPVPTDTACSMPSGGPGLTLAGTVLGVAVRRGYDACTGNALARWSEVLRVPATVGVIVWDAYPPGVRVVGGTAAQRRAVRATLQQVGDVPVTEIRLGRAAGRPTVTVTTGDPPWWSPLSPADLRWLATAVRLDVVQRLAGRPAARPRETAYGELSAIATRLRDRATRAGWYVRVAQGWNLRGGAFLVTLRLTERQLLTGRTDWLETIAPDRRTGGYTVRIAIEAPDGTVLGQPAATG